MIEYTYQLEVIGLKAEVIYIASHIGACSSQRRPWAVGTTSSSPDYLLGQMWVRLQNIK